MLQATVAQEIKVSKTLIQETSDYELFKDLPHNRPVVRNHVLQLARSLRERPHLRVSRPVLVNDKMQVIDGQHRLAASIINEQSVFFMVVPKLTVDDARLLNALQRTWRILDYAYSYASSKVPGYVQFVEAYEEYKLPPSIIMEVLHTTKSNRRILLFRTGQMQAIDQANLDNTLSEIKEILDCFPNLTNGYGLAMAVMAARKTDGFDHDRLVQKLKENPPTRQADRVSYLRELERVYNIGIMFNGPNYRRFY
jgi:hypothetical protein